MCEKKYFYVIADIQAKILPGVTHWQSPNYFAYYPSNSSIAGFLGEMLSAGLNIVGFSWITSPAATELEIIVLDWLAKILNLPDKFLSSGEGHCYIILLRLSAFIAVEISICNMEYVLLRNSKTEGEHFFHFS